MPIFLPCWPYDNLHMMSLISIAIVKYSAQNCLNAVVSTDLFAYSFKMSSNVYAVKQGEMDDNMVNVNLTIYA
jgi:hypothetical protein